MIARGSRRGVVQFKIESQEDAAVHGFAGYFTCVLYKEVTLSTEPRTHSPGMFSWFPMFLPLSSPILVRRGDIVRVHVWRLVTEEKVWYEWCLDSPLVMPLQNHGGATFSVKLK